MSEAHTPSAIGAPSTVRFRGGGFEITPKRWFAPAFAAVLVGAWQLGSTSGRIDPLFLPGPVDVIETLYHELAQGDLAIHIGKSLTRLLLGWLIGSLAGLSVGLAMGLWSWCRAIGDAAISSLYPIPKIALLPLFILWLGIGESSKITTIALGVFFPMAVSVCAAVDAAPRPFIRMAQSFGLDRMAIIVKVVLPSALPAMFACARITISTGLVLLVAAEMIGAQYGIGAYILAAGNIMDSEKLLAGVLVLSLLGTCAGAVIAALERTLLRWR